MTLPAPQAEKLKPGAQALLACLRLEGLPANRDTVVPLAVGIPFSRGARHALEGLELVDAEGALVPSEWRSLGVWPDGSVRWAVADFLAPPELRGNVELYLIEGEAGKPSTARLELVETESALRIDTGAVVFSVLRSSGAIAVEIPVQGEPRRVSLETALTLAGGRAVRPVVERIGVDGSGPIRTTLRLEGKFESTEKPGAFRFDMRLSFFASTGIIELALTLHNPWPAKHPGGLWDLGDEGSLYFESLALTAGASGAIPQRLVWTAEPGSTHQECNPAAFALYQASSGGDNWKSRNHVDRSGQVPLSFRGYRVRADGKESHGLRANPVVTLEYPGWRLSAAVEKFWEQFPKAIATVDGGLRVDLFPRLEGSGPGATLLHELQGGEKKTHHAVFSLASTLSSQASCACPLAWVQEPVRVIVDAEYLTSTGALGPLVPDRDDPHGEYKALIANAVEGPSSFFAKREVIDEYGWRHFGEVYADHENTHARGERPVISHYNNQYDLVQGLLVQFVRSGDSRWFELGQDLARHVVDIDIYHTTLDKPGYNGGFFWHSDHYTDAYRATHRTYSQDSPQARSGKPYGGGPSNEQNYSSGLLLYHYLTGCPLARDAVLTLANWVHDMDDGSKTVLGVLDKGPTGNATPTAEASYHGPGRGAGNSVRTLLNAFELTGDRRHLEKAQELIRRVIHPLDDLQARDLGNLEARWSYLVFLQVLGKFLDVKSSLGERDEHWVHARHSLAVYVHWMLEHEVPYARVLDKVEFPTETWPAHDIRKSVVFDYAAIYGKPELRERCRDQAEFYFRESLAGVAAFATRACARPLAILLQNGFLRSAFRLHPRSPEPWIESSSNPGVPEAFLGQKERVKRLLRTPAGAMRLAALMFKPVALWRLLRAVLGRR